LYDSIDQSPSVRFDVIINPSSGPGTSVGALPDAGWTDALTELNARNNSHALGYVHTSWGQRCIGEIQTDILAYVKWSAENSSHQISGFFFDETPVNDTSFMTGYMQTVTSFARTVLNLPSSRIIFNPGAPPASAYYNIADVIVTFEGENAGFSNFLSSPEYIDMTASEKAQAAYIIRDFNGTTSEQADLVQSIASENISALFITTAPNYEVISQDLPQLAAEVKALR